MIVPGSNLLGMALNLIRPQTVDFYEDIGRIKSPDGEYVTQLANKLTIDRCSVQAVDRDKYHDLGLSASRSYFVWYVMRDVKGVERGKSGDVVEFQGRRYQISSDRPWFGMDGWDGSLMCDIGPATGKTTTPMFDKRAPL